MTFWEKAGTLRFQFTEDAKKELRKIATNKAYYSKVMRLIDDACEHPFSGLGKPEPLKHRLRGFWSRRIDAKNRLVYKVVAPDLIVVSLIGHYP
jgi:toxin YoeB